MTLGSFSTEARKAEHITNEEQVATDKELESQLCIKVNLILIVIIYKYI